MNNNKNYELIKPLILEEMEYFFKNHPDENLWRGPVTQLFRLLHSNPLNDGMLRFDIIKLGEVLKDLAAEGLVHSIPGTVTPAWAFMRSSFQPQPPALDSVNATTLEIKRPDTFRPYRKGPALTERELLALMSAIIMGTGVDHFTSPASAVLSADEFAVRLKP